MTGLAEWCQAKLDRMAPLTPAIGEISETEYLAWVSKYKARVFRDSLELMKNGERNRVGDMYAMPVTKAKEPIDGVDGVWMYQDLARGKKVTDFDLDAVEREFHEVMRIFRISGIVGGVKRIGAFIAFPENQQPSIKDAVMDMIHERLQNIAGCEEDGD